MHSASVLSLWQGCDDSAGRDGRRWRRKRVTGLLETRPEAGVDINLGRVDGRTGARIGSSHEGTDEVDPLVAKAADGTAVAKHGFR